MKKDRGRKGIMMCAAIAVVMICTTGTAFAAAKPNTETVQTKNALLEATRKEKKNGPQKWLRVEIPKKTLKIISEPEFREFCEEVVEPSEDNWVSIVCGDGTGIQFAGAFAGAAEYGKIDCNGQIDEPLGYIGIKDDVYYYVDASDAE